MQHTSTRFAGGRLLCLLCSVRILLATVSSPPMAHAGGTVANCTEADLDAALAGGGTVTFACDGTITVTGPKTISADTILDGAGHILTISGGNSVQLFRVS